MAVRSSLARAFLALAVVLAGVIPGLGQSGRDAPLIETTARQALVMDGETGAVLLEKNADEPFPPASLAKLMTMEIALHALAEGRIALDTSYPVSENAWRTGGAPSRTSTMFAAVRSSVPVEALLRGIAVQNANDAAIVLAEGLEGTEGAFAAAMNERAAELGLTGSRFVNATGLPAAGQSVTARDMARLARHIERSYPAEYRLYAEPEFIWNDIRQRNRNPLLGRDIGATGLALGFDEGTGYAIVGATDRDGRKTFVALGGLESDAARTSESVRLLAWAQESFDRRTLFPAQAEVGRAVVYGGTTSEVPLMTGEALVALIPRDAPESVRGALVYEGPLQAPVAAGERVGTLQILLNGRPSVAQDLFAAEAVSEGTFSARALGAVRELAFGWIRTL